MAGQGSEAMAPKPQAVGSIPLTPAKKPGAFLIEKHPVLSYSGIPDEGIEP